MEQTITSAIQLNDLLTLQEIILKMPYFQHLHYSIDQEAFRDVLMHLQYVPLVRRQHFKIIPRFVYVFLSDGTLSQQEKCKKIRQGKRLLSHSAQNFGLQEQKRKFQRTKMFESLDYLLENEYSNRNSMKIFISSKNSIVLTISAKQLSQETLEQLKEIKQEKVNALKHSQMFQGAELYLAAEIEKHFQMLQIQFDEWLYCEFLRREKIFILLSGTVEVTLDSGSYLREGKGVLFGHYGSARCISDRLVCYAVDREILQKKISTRNIDQLSDIYSRNHSPRKFTQIPFSLPCTRLSSSFTPSMTSSCLTTPFPKGATSSMSQTFNISSEVKKLRLRQHFSNHLNEVYDIFSEIKTKKMEQDKDNVDGMVLYKLDIPQKKSPEMSQIKHRLKQIRNDKFQKFMKNVVSKKDQDFNCFPLLALTAKGKSCKKTNPRKRKMELMNFRHIHRPQIRRV